MRPETLVLAMLLMILAPFTTLGGTATQTDWSAGSGILGPVTNWGSAFFEADSILFSDPSDITMPLVPTEHTVDDNFGGAYSVYAADIDGDNDIDILGAAEEDDAITWWENTNGIGTVWDEHIIDGDFDAAHCVYAADVNDDGDMDVLGAAYNDHAIIWWENTDGIGTVWDEHTVEGNFYRARSVYAADIDGDGDMDVLGGAHYIIWWENTNGIGTTWTEHDVSGYVGSVLSVYAYDVDSDGDMDVLSASISTDDITWWENTNGIGTVWAEHTIDGDFDDAASVYAADVDGDGDVDVLGAAGSADDITWWENTNGIGTVWAEHTIDGDFDGAWTVKAADVDGDGDMDVLGAAKDANDITWWENTNGIGTVWVEHTVDDNFVGAYSVYAADVDGDGDVDVLGAAITDNDITWWDIFDLSYPSSGYLDSSILDADLADSESWLYLDWNSTEPTGTSVEFQVRASSNSAIMGSWSSTITTPCDLSTMLDDGDHYFQYRVTLSTTNTDLTSTLHDMTVTWEDYVGTEEEPEAEVASFALYGARPNPAIGHATLVFSLPMDSKAELTVYDLTGRTIHSVSGEYSAGIHEVILEDLASGIYLVRITSSGFTATQNFVVFE